MRNDDHLIFENYFKKHTENKDHTSCKYAEEGCDCDKCKECEANQAKSEDAEGLPASIEAKRKERKNIGSVRTEDAEDLNVHPGDWGDSYQEVKSLIDQLLSYGLDKSILSGILQYAEEVGYTGESVDNLVKLIQHFNQRGVQDS